MKGSSAHVDPHDEPATHCRENTQRQYGDRDPRANPPHREFPAPLLVGEDMLSDPTVHMLRTLFAYGLQ